MISRATSALILTTAIQMAVAMAVVAVPSIAPLAARDLGVPSSMVGAYVSVAYVGAATAALIGGGLVLRMGAIRLSQVGLLLCGLGLAVGLAPSVAIVALSALLVGFGYGPITPASSHVLAKTATPQTIALTLSIKQTGVPAGLALAGLIVPPLAVAFGWRVSVLIVALLCGAVAIAAQAMRSNLDADRDVRARVSAAQIVAGLRLVLGTPRLRNVAAVSFIYSGMQVALSSFVVSYLADEIGFSIVRAGLGLTVASVCGVVARVIWGAVADRYMTPRITLAWLGILMSVFAVLTASLAGWPFAVILLVLAGFGATAIGWNGVYLAEVAQLAPKGQAGLATGGCLFITFFGVVLCPGLFGLLQDATGSYATSFIAAAAVCGGAALLQFADARRARA
jgi:predicted MFS family arabinose efflux permease